MQCGRQEQTKVFQVLGNCLCLLKWSDEGWLRSLRWGELDTSPLTQHFLDKASLSLYFTVNNIPQLCIQKIKAGYTVTASCIQNRYTELNCKYFLFQHHGMELNIYAIIMCPFYSSLQIKVILSILYLCLYTNLIACNFKNLHNILHLYRYLWFPTICIRSTNSNISCISIKCIFIRCLCWNQRLCK